MTDNLKDILEKQALQTEYRQFKIGDVNAIDHLLKITRGIETVDTEKAWVAVGKVFEFWTRRYPEEWAQFVESIEEIRLTRLVQSGLSKSKEIKYVGALPYRFERMLKILFPNQPFNKKFVYKLIDKIKITRVGEKRDTWFTV